MPGENSVVPTENSVGLNHLETSPPTGPASVQHHPQEPVAAVEAQATRRVLLENCKLVTKREDLRLQGSTGSKSGGDDPQWGVVAELPNASEDGPDELGALQGAQVTFSGYYRLWDEGHAHGSAAPSNPHHVLELHPTWAFGSDSSNFAFNSPELVKSMDGFSGYGASKFRPLFKTLDSKDWLNAWQDNDFVYVQLRESSNFHQLPVEVREVRTVTGGHEVVNVFSDKQFSHLVHENLRVIAATGSPIDDELSSADRGSQMFLLGFFSVNLQKVVQVSQDAHSEADAVSAPDALEFFAFGRATQNAVSTCN